MLSNLLFTIAIFLAFIFFVTAPTRKKAVLWLCVLIASLILLLLITLLSSASAAENPTPPAPTESAMTVKGYTSCPTELNPDDSAWAMHDIKYELKKFEEDIVVVEHRRIFSYFPDAEQRIFVGMKKWKNPACVAELFSYGSTSGTSQKRVWGAIRSSDGTVQIITTFLLTDKGWEKGGTSMPETFAACSAGQCNIVFTLYRNKVQMASRALPVEPAKRFFHFQFNEEPVE